MSRSRERLGWLVVSPAIVLVGVFFVAPIFLTIWMSLTNWPLFGKVRYLGGANYAQIVHDPTFLHALFFTAVYTAIVTPVQVAVGYALAVVVRRGLRGVGLFRTIYFIPVVIGFAAAGYEFYVMFQPQTGVIDVILHVLGIGNGTENYLASPSAALAVVVVLTTWKTVGTAMILFMVGMHGVAPELEEAAAVDGAGWWRKEFHVIMPLVRRTTALVLVITIAGSFLVFDQFYILTQGGPDSATVTAVLWVYTEAFVYYRLGYAATLCISILVVLTVVSITQLRVLRTER